jgi:beta-lactamase regulating signal transducer with metallopeptidase domain
MYLYLDIHSFGERLLQAFSWMLVHSLWQGMLIALLAVIFLQLSSKAASAVRYNILLMHFAAFAVACMVTFFRELTGSVSQRAVPLADSIGQGASTLFRLDAVHVKTLAVSSAAYISANAHLLVILWALFFAFRSFSMIQGMRYLRHARKQQVYVAAAEWRTRLQQLCTALGVTKSVRLLESAFVKVPIVAGHLKPVILMPAGLLTGLPAQQIEAVLLHELAHIRRHDYIVNLLQVCCETVFFFNPGFLWMSVLLRDEREHCCDDIALQQTGSKKTFIEALISFKEYTLSSQYPAVAFPGRKNQLLQRVSRIINNRHQSLGTAEKICFFTGIALLSVVLSTAAITQLGRHTSMKINTPYVLAKGEELLALPVKAVPDTVVPAPPPAVVVTRHEPIITVTHHKPAVKETPQVSVLHTGEVSPAPAPSAAPDMSEGHMSDPTPEVQAQRDMIEANRQQKEQARLDRLQAEKDRHQATLDKLQADRDRKQAVFDRLQADKDREQARLDRIQADKDRQQADRDRAQAEKDRQQGIIDRSKADQERATHEMALAKHEAEKKALRVTRYNGNYNANRYPGNAQ